MGEKRPSLADQRPLAATAIPQNSSIDALIATLKKDRPTYLVDEGSNEMAAPTREEIDAKLAASEARMETRAAISDGKLDLVLAKLASIGEKMDDVRSDNRTTRANIWAVCAIVVTTIVGMAALVIAVAPAAFTIGAQVRDMVQKEMAATPQATKAP
jgi:hypothetical protein